MYFDTIHPSLLSVTSSRFTLHSPAKGWQCLEIFFAAKLSSEYRQVMLLSDAAKPSMATYSVSMTTNQLACNIASVTKYCIRRRL